MDAEGWDRRYAAAERVFSAEPNPIVAGELSDVGPGRALDLAAGEGRHALWLARRGWQVTAVDFSRVGMEKGRSDSEAESLAVTWVLEDAYRYEPPTAAFDLVLIAHFHPRPADRARVFGRAAAALRSGGRLLILGRHAADIGRDGGRGPSDPGLRYTPEELRDQLPPGLAVERCEPVRRTIDGDDGPLELTDVVALARRG